MKNESLAFKATRGTIYLFLSSYSVTAINFIGGIILSRLLVPEYFGIVSLAVVYVTAFSVLKDWGVESAVLYKKDATERFISTLFWLQAGISFLSVLLAVLSSFLLKDVLVDPTVATVLLVLGLFIFIDAIGAIPRTMLEKSFAFRALALVEIVSYAGALLIGVYGAYQGWGVWTLVVYRVIPIIVKTASFWILTDFRLMFTFEKEAVVWFYKRFGVPIFLTSLFSIVLFQFDNFLIGTFVGTVTLGYYTRAYSLAGLPTQLITQIVSRIAFPIYSSCQDDLPKLTRVFSLFLKAIWRLSLPLAILLFVLAPELILLLLGEKWLPTVPYLQLLVGYSICRILIDDTGPLFSGGLGRPQVSTRIFFTQVLVFIPLGVVLTKLWGAVGTAISVNIVMLLGVILSYYQLYKILHIKLIEIFLRPIIAAALTVGVYYGLLNSFSTGVVIADLVVKSFILLITYATLLLSLEYKIIMRESREMLQYARKSKP